MAARSPIFSAKQVRHQIGYTEDNEAFDLVGRKRCNYCAKSGNLHDPDSGRIVGYVSLQGKLIGASWVTDKLFSKSDGNPQEIRRGEDHLNSPSRVAADETFEQRDTEDAYAVSSTDKTRISPASEHGEPRAELLSLADGNPDREILRKEDYLDSPSLVVADEIFEQCDTEDAYSARGIGEKPSSPPSEHAEPAPELFSDPDSNPDQEILHNDSCPQDPSRVVADEIFEQRETEDAYAATGIAEMGSLAPSEQGEPALELFLDSDQEILRKEISLHNPARVVADEISERRETEDVCAASGLGETPSPPPSEHGEPASELFSDPDSNLTKKSFGKRVPCMTSAASQRTSFMSYVTLRMLTGHSASRKCLAHLRLNAANPKRSCFQDLTAILPRKSFGKTVSCMILAASQRTKFMNNVVLRTLTRQAALAARQPRRRPNMTNPQRGSFQIPTAILRRQFFCKRVGFMIPAVLRRTRRTSTVTLGMLTRPIALVRCQAYGRPNKANPPQSCFQIRPTMLTRKSFVKRIA